MLMWRLIGLAIALGVAVFAGFLVYDFGTNFERFARLSARRSGRRLRRSADT